MPKETYILKTFDKGLVTQKEARDLENDAIYLSDGLDYSHSGKIKLLGNGWSESAISTAISINYLTSTAGVKRLLTFQYDYDLGITGTQDGVEWNPSNSGTGYLGTPKFRKGGVTYYIVNSGEKNNEITILASYKNDEGIPVFTIIPPGNPTYNSSVFGAFPGNHSPWLRQQFSGQDQDMHVGPDSNADIVGYFVNGGFRYCDANFDNVNNNIVGYFGHIKRNFLSELNNVRVPGNATSNTMTNLSFSRNHWHFNTYEHPKRFGSYFNDADISARLENHTRGMNSWSMGVHPASYDGATQWTKPNQGFPNYKLSITMIPNTDKHSDDLGYTWSLAGGNDDGEGTDADGDRDFAFIDTMEDGHELRKRWHLGASTVYDGDPQGICQETAVTTCAAHYSPDGGETHIQRKYIFNFKDVRANIPIESGGTVASAFERLDAMDDAGGTIENPRTANFSSFPKLYFTWTFLPWWGDSEYLATASPVDVDPVTNRIDTDSPLYDSRITGFRIYMQDVDDPEEKWYNVATIDALRGIVKYEGCSTEQHPWLPRGNIAEDYGSNAGDVQNALYRLEASEGTPERTEMIACWSNYTTGRSQVKTGHDLKTSVVISVADMQNETATGTAGNAIDPLDHSNCKSSVNVESIPDITYELLNGYKDKFSPTCTNHQHESWHSGLFTNSDGDFNVQALQRKYGDVHRFKTATVLNDKVYIGNIFNTTTKIHSPDRILKTEPGQHDIFPDDGFHHIDLATGDGDSIVHMENYFGKLFIWKHKSLYVLKIGDEGDESIESSHHYYGIDNKHHVVITKHGPVWFNEGGLYLYDMQGKIHNLIVDKLSRGNYINNFEAYLNEPISNDTPEEILYFILDAMHASGMEFDINEDGNLDVLDVIGYINSYFGGLTEWLLKDIYVSQVKFGWKGFVGSTGSGNKPVPMIGYLEKADKLIIYKDSELNGFLQSSGDAYIFDFFTKNWSYGRKLFPYGTGVRKSNFINDADGNLVYLYEKQFPESDEIAPEVHMNKWNDSPVEKHHIQFVTKDIDFESPGIRKKIYKLYISVAGNVTPNVVVMYAINGSKQFKPFNMFNGKQNYSIEQGFQSPYEQMDDSNEAIGDKWYTAILKPDSAGESLNNIYSIQLMFVGRNHILDTPYVDFDPFTFNSDAGNYRPPMPPDIADDNLMGGPSGPPGLGTVIDTTPNIPTFVPPGGHEGKLEHGLSVWSRGGFTNSTPSGMDTDPDALTHFDVHQDFQINDITIVYRAKNAR